MTYEELPKDTVNLVILVDDGSTDATLEIARDLGLEIFVHDRNYGYGANQKTCYTEALRAGCDVVVMVHPDYQYDPTLVPKIIEPIVAGEADLVLGSRLKGGGSAISAGHAVVEVRLQPVPHRGGERGLRARAVGVPHRVPGVQPRGAGDGELPDELGRVRLRPGDHRPGGGGAISASPRSPCPCATSPRRPRRASGRRAVYGLKILWVVDALPAAPVGHQALAPALEHPRSLHAPLPRTSTPAPTAEGHGQVLRSAALAPSGSAGSV